MMRRARAFALGLLLVAVVVPAQAARLALVIGNADYLEGPLRNPVRDARAVATKLGGLGFAVTKVENLKRDDIGRTVETFASAIRPGDDVVVYYAGHGVQVKGTNYLPAVDARIQRETDVAMHSLNLGDLLDLLDQAKAGVKVVLLDACRNIPYARSFRDGSRGLARIANAPSGTLIHYATRPGQVAADGDGANGLYTTQLLKAMDAPGQPVELLFKQVASEVKRISKGEQEPWVEGNLDGVFMFNAGPGRTQGAAPIAPPALPGESSADFADLERAQQQTVEARKKWSAWQAAMQAAFDKAATLTATPEIEAKAWERFLAAHGQDNPYSTDDERLRATATERQKAALARGRVEPERPSTAKPGGIGGLWREAGTVFRDCPTCPEMVVVPGGSFVMGSPASEPGRTASEGPTRTVNVPKFALSRTEVTRGEFRRFVEATQRPMRRCSIWDGKAWKISPTQRWDAPGFAQTDDDPVVCVSHEDATAYVDWLRSGGLLSFRLPSEAEWEYAARAGTRGPAFWNEGASKACRYANVADQSAKALDPSMELFACNDGRVATAPVGSYAANPFGLHDMLGNVLEWVADCYVDHYRDAPTDGSVNYNGICSVRVARGGSWVNGPSRVRAAARLAIHGSVGNVGVGFRVARTLW